MAVIQINGDKRLIATIDRVAKFSAGTRETLNEIGDTLLDEFDKQMDTEGSRLTRKWKALDSKTIEQRIRMGYGAGPILNRTGKLKNAFKKAVGLGQVRVHNPTEYFKYHQLGTKDIPKRQMIAMPERLKQDVVEIVRKGLDKTLTGRL